MFTIMLKHIKKFSIEDVENAELIYGIKRVG